MRWVLVIIFFLKGGIGLQAQDSTVVDQQKVQLAKNSIEVGNRFELYASPYKDRVYTYIQYGRKINCLNAFGRLLRYSLGENVAYMGEVDLYLKFKKNGYGYFNAGYSGAQLLPTYRGRLEIYRSAGQVEYSLGGGVVKPFNYNIIPIITGTIGYYFGNYFAYARPTVSFVEDGVAKSIFLSGRRYFTKDDFIEMSFLKGEDTGAGRTFNAVENSFGLDTYLARLSGRMLRGKYKFGAGLDYGGLYIPTRSEYANFFGFDFYVNRAF